MKKPLPKLLIITKRLWHSHIRKHLRKIILTSVLLVISAACTSVQPWLIQQAVDKIFGERSELYLMTIPPLIALAFTIQAVTLYLSNRLMGSFTNGIIADMRKTLFRHAIDNEIEFYSKIDSGSIMSRIAGEMMHIAAAIGGFFNAWCRQLITSIGLFFGMLYQSVELTILSIIVFVFAVYPLQRITKRLKKLSRQVNDQNGNLISRLMESMSGILTVKAFRKEEFEIEKIGGYIDEIEELSNKTNSISIITAPMLQILSGCAVAFVIWFGGSEMIAGRMTQGNLVAFLAALMMFSRPVRSLSNAGGMMVKGYIAADRFFEVLDSKPKYISREHGETLVIERAAVALDNVSFSYPNGAQALESVSFTMEAGKKTALVGHSGSGKSTIFNLLMKFYEPTAGHVRIDGQDLAKASINSARAQMALVSQDIFIFDETAMNNIGYGKDGASEEEIIEAAKAAHCHDFIMQLPKGYHTKLGFAGETLSGGQKQRIAIARAFLRNAPILLLDEATSALDPRTESDIQDSLERLSKGRTSIVIAHRLSTVVNADKMVLMHEGKVAAIGTHESLLAESELYRNHFGI